MLYINITLIYMASCGIDKHLHDLEREEDEHGCQKVHVLQCHHHTRGREREGGG